MISRSLFSGGFGSRCHLDNGAFVGGVGDQSLEDFDFAVLRRVVSEDSSRDECINNILVVKISLVDKAQAAARNAHKTETCAMVLSLILCHGFMARIWFMLVSLWNTTILMGEIPLPFCIDAVALTPQDGFGDVIGHGSLNSFGYNSDLKLSCNCSSER